MMASAKDKTEASQLLAIKPRSSKYWIVTCNCTLEEEKMLKLNFYSDIGYHVCMLLKNAVSEGNWSFHCVWSISVKKYIVGFQFVIKMNMKTNKNISLQNKMTKGAFGFQESNVLFMSLIAT